jgi:hypothetical protein
MAPHLAAAASTAGQPGAGIALLDWLAAHPIVAGIILGLALVLGHLAGCHRCRSRRRARRQRRTTAVDRALGRSGQRPI